jgi:hypothetical protein
VADDFQQAQTLLWGNHMNTRLPIVPAAYSVDFFNQLVQSLTTYFGQAVSKDEETSRIILRSPNGTRYDVKVTDAGALTITPTTKERA